MWTFWVNLPAVVHCLAWCHVMTLVSRCVKDNFGKDLNPPPQFRLFGLDSWKGTKFDTKLAVVFLLEMVNQQIGCVFGFKWRYSEDCLFVGSCTQRCVCVFLHSEKKREEMKVDASRCFKFYINVSCLAQKRQVWYSKHVRFFAFSRCDSAIFLRYFCLSYLLKHLVPIDVMFYIIIIHDYNQSSYENMWCLL